MKRSMLVILLAAALVASPAFAREVMNLAGERAMKLEARRPATSEILAQQVADSLVVQSGWADGEVVRHLLRRPPIGPPAPFDPIIEVEREMFTDDIAHYTYLVRTGDGEYDVIRLHRVVREEAPYDPVRADSTVFLLHGDGVGFVKFIFGFASPSAPEDRSAALYLAQNGVDVWGIDQDWALVPLEETDFAFMADWGFQRQIDNTLFGVRVARYVRLFTGNGFARMPLLGYSSGGLTAIGAANQETQLPPGQRQLSGVIPVDILYKFDEDGEAGRLAACGVATDYQDLIDAGQYFDPSGGVLFLALSELAAGDPGGDSPILPGFTNLQTMLFVVGATYQLFPFSPTWHYMGPELDEFGLPAGLQYTTIDEAIDFLGAASPYEPSAFLRDYGELLCDEVDVPYDDHLDEISIPVLYLGAAGGIGEAGLYTTTLLTDAGVTVAIGSLRPPEEVLLDIGHIDIWTAPESETLFWEPLLQWIVDHD